MKSSNFMGALFIEVHTQSKSLYHIIIVFHYEEPSQNIFNVIGETTSQQLVFQLSNHKGSMLELLTKWFENLNDMSEGTFVDQGIEQNSRLCIKKKPNKKII